MTLISFPMTVGIGGLRVPFQNAAELLARYAEIFTPEMRQAIEQGDPKAVRTVTTGSRALVIALEVPDRVDTSDAPSGMPPAGPVPPRRISVRAGPWPTRLAGALGASVDEYLLFVPKGAFVEVRLERVGRAAVMRVTSAQTRAPLNPRASQGALVVSGRAPADGEYRIEVERSAGGPASLPYMLSVTMR